MVSGAQITMGLSRASLSRVDTLLSQGNFAREEKKAAIARGLFYVAELMLG
jgi:hypothetical protein